MGDQILPHQVAFVIYLNYSNPDTNKLFFFWMHQLYPEVAEFIIEAFNVRFYTIYRYIINILYTDRVAGYIVPYRISGVPVLISLLSYTRL